MTDLAQTPALALAPAAPPGPASRHLLGARLRKLRTARSLRLEDVAARLEVAPSTLSRIETGQAPLRTSYLYVMLDLYGITDPAERTELADQARQGQRKSWWDEYADLLPVSAGHYLALESAAAAVRSYHPQTVPGLLQTPAYAAAYAARPGLAPARASLAALQARRRTEIARHGTPHVHLIIDRTALTRPVAPAEVMAAQIQYIASSLPASPALTIQVTGPSSPVLSPGFTLFSFPAKPSVGCCPAPGGEVVTTTSRDALTAMNLTWHALTRAALTPADAAELLGQLAAAP